MDFFFFIFKDFSKLNSLKIFYIYLGIIILLLFFLTRAILIYKNFLFRIHGNCFELKQGVLKKTNTSVAFDRIQNVNFKQNIIQQIINVFQVEIETAGSQKTEIIIKALKPTDAKLLKEILLKYQQVNQEKVPVKKVRIFLSIKVKELLKVGLTENHLISLVLMISFLFAGFQQIIGFYKSFNVSFKNYFKEGINTISQSVTLFVSLLFFVLLISVLTSIIRVFLKHFNLKISIHKKSFEIKQGLFTVHSILLKSEKIQTITFSTNLLKRILGISYVVFRQAISGKVTNNKKKIIRIVGCKDFHVQRIKEIFLNVDKEIFSKNYNSDIFLKKRGYIISFLLLIGINVFIIIVFKNSIFLFVNLLLFPIFFSFSYMSYKKRYYSLSNEFIFVANGVIDVDYTYLPFFKVQNIALKQSIFQKRSNVLDVVFQTASGKIIIPCLKETKALEIYNYTLYKIESSTKKWM